MQLWDLHPKAMDGLLPTAEPAAMLLLRLLLLLLLLYPLRGMAEPACQGSTCLQRVLPAGSYLQPVGGLQAWHDCVCLRPLELQKRHPASISSSGAPVGVCNACVRYGGGGVPFALPRGVRRSKPARATGVRYRQQGGSPAALSEWLWGGQVLVQVQVQLQGPVTPALHTPRWLVPPLLQEIVGC
jgi:hypothetical protein